MPAPDQAGTAPQWNLEREPWARSSVHERLPIPGLAARRDSGRCRRGTLHASAASFSLSGCALHTAPYGHFLRRLGPYVIGCWVASGCEEGALGPSAGRGAGRRRPGCLDTKNLYAATVRVKSPELAEGHGKPPLCSGTVIGPRLVLTAAHCVCKRRDVSPEVLARMSASAKEKPPAERPHLQGGGHKGRNVTEITTASDCTPGAEVEPHDLRRLRPRGRTQGDRPPLRGHGGGPPGLQHPVRGGTCGLDECRPGR